MIPIIELSDLPADVASQAMVAAWLAGANARAIRVAPCLGSTSPAPTSEQLAEARLVLIGAIIRWSQAGAGSFQSQTAGSFGITVDTRQRGGYNLWPSEISQLQDICKTGAEGRAFSIDTAPRFGTHSEFCSVVWGSACSCGVDVAGTAIYEI